jgi:hypothetical protein
MGDRPPTYRIAFLRHQATLDPSPGDHHCIMPVAPSWREQLPKGR